MSNTWILRRVIIKYVLILYINKHLNKNKLNLLQGPISIHFSLFTYNNFWKAEWINSCVHITGYRDFRYNIQSLYILTTGNICYQFWNSFCMFCSIYNYHICIMQDHKSFTYHLIPELLKYIVNIYYSQFFCFLRVWFSGVTFFKGSLNHLSNNSA